MSGKQLELYDYNTVEKIRDELNKVKILAIPGAEMY